VSASSDQQNRQLSEALEYLQALGPKPEIGLVLGSGLGGFANQLTLLAKARYADIPHMAQPSVHAGEYCLGQVADATVACLRGRVHCYEGHATERVVFGVRLLAALDCRAVLLTNAAGGIRPGMKVGDLMLIVDHINLSGHNPLVGPDDQQGRRFVDLTCTYDPALREAARRAARKAQVDLAEGVYAAMLGPSYETPAEIRMLARLGADAVGMSTVPEAIALRALGVRLGAMSLITNLAAGISDKPLDHGDVQAAAMRTRDRFEQVLTGWVKHTHRLLG
jgi:purine-nucleoside phosphorylase